MRRLFSWRRMLHSHAADCKLFLFGASALRSLARASCEATGKDRTPWRALPRDAFGSRPRRLRPLAYETPAPLRPSSSSSSILQKKNPTRKKHTTTGSTSHQRRNGAGCTVIVRVGGLGSFTPKLSKTFIETTWVTTSAKLIRPGDCAELADGFPSGNSHE